MTRNLIHLSLVVISLLAMFIGEPSQAATRLVPRTVVIAVENSVQSRWCLTTARTFASEILNSVPLGNSVYLYEFNSQVRPLGHTLNLTQSQVSLLKDRLPRKVSRDPCVDFDHLADVLKRHNSDPAAVVVITAGRSCPPANRPFVEPAFAFADAFPDSENHSIILAGLTDSIFSSEYVPPQIFRFRLDTRTGTLPRVQKDFFFARLRLPEPTFVPTWKPAPSFTPTKPPRPSQTPKPTIKRVAAVAKSNPTSTITPRPQKTVTFTHTPTTSPSKTPTPKSQPLISLIEDSSETVSAAHRRLRGKGSYFENNWPICVGVILIIAIVMTIFYSGRTTRQVAAALDLGANDDSIEVMEVSVEGPDGTVVDPEEFILESRPEVVVVGDSAKSNLYVPDLKPAIRFRLLPHGRIQRWVGYKWDEIFHGQIVDLGNGLNLAWSFERRPREEGVEGGLDR